MKKRKRKKERKKERKKSVLSGHWYIALNETHLGIFMVCLNPTVHLRLIVNLQKPLSRDLYKINEAHWMILRNLFLCVYGYKTHQYTKTSEHLHLFTDIDKFNYIWRIWIYQSILLRKHPCTHTYTHTHTHTHTHIYIYIYIYVCVCVCMHIYICVCVCGWVGDDCVEHMLHMKL